MRRTNIEYLIAAGKIAKFSDLFRYIEAHDLAEKSEIPAERIAEIVRSPHTIRVTEMARIAGALGITAPRLAELL